MTKIRLTKGELKRQRDSLEQFRHYLPTLQLKKQQLQIKIIEIRQIRDRKIDDFNKKQKEIDEWVGLLADSRISVDQWVVPTKFLLEKTNIAGATIPILEGIIFDDTDYDYFLMPFWIDKGIAELRIWMQLFIEINVVNQQIDILEKEHRITMQRVNLFEKIKIPEAVENIRRIRISLGDQQTNAVGISKVAKKKIEASTYQEVLA